MGRRNNDYGGDLGIPAETRRGGGGGGFVLALVVVIGVVYLVHAVSSYLQTYVPVADGADVNVGAWAVGALVAVFLAWCFLSESKGGR